MAKENGPFMIVRERKAFPNPRALATIKQEALITYEQLSLFKDAFTGRQLPTYLQETAIVNKIHIANALTHIDDGTIIVLPYDTFEPHFKYEGLISTDTTFVYGGFFSNCEFYNHQTGLSIVEKRPFPVLLIQGEKIAEISKTGSVLHRKNNEFAIDVLHALTASSRGHENIRTSSGISVTQEKINKYIKAVNSGFYEPLSEDFDEFGGTAKGTY